jgi:hypothetical protein
MTETGMYAPFDDTSLLPAEDRYNRILRKIAYGFSKFGLFQDQVEEPIFIIGSARSGTTILLRVIESNSDLATYPGEALDLWFPRAFPWRRSDLSKPPFWLDPEKFTRMSNAEWSQKDTQKLRSVFGSFLFLKGKKFFMNKQAMSSFLLPFMLRIYPKARFVHIYRDGRAVALSYAKQEHLRMQTFPEPYKKKGLNIGFDELLEHTARLWNTQILQIDKDIKALNLEGRNQILEVSYEQFCAAPQAIVQRIADFTGLNSDNFQYQDYSTVKTANTKFGSEMDESTLTKITELMAPALKLKGYL